MIPLLAMAVPYAPPMSSTNHTDRQSKREKVSRDHACTHSLTFPKTLLTGKDHRKSNAGHAHYWSPWWAWGWNIIVVIIFAVVIQISTHIACFFNSYCCYLEIIVVCLIGMLIADVYHSLVVDVKVGWCWKRDGHERKKRVLQKSNRSVFSAAGQRLSLKFKIIGWSFDFNTGMRKYIKSRRSFLWLKYSLRSNSTYHRHVSILLHFSPRGTFFLSCLIILQHSSCNIHQVLTTVGPTGRHVQCSTLSQKEDRYWIQQPHQF